MIMMTMSMISWISDGVSALTFGSIFRFDQVGGESRRVSLWRQNWRAGYLKREHIPESAVKCGPVARYFSNMRRVCCGGDTQAINISGDSKR
jgi:hypothetical protein